MRRKLSTALILALLVTLLTVAAVGAVPPPSSGKIPGEPIGTDRL